RIGRVPLNDGVLHLTAAERLGQSIWRGEPLLDPWVSEWSLGYPVWRSYQPLPHLGAAIWLKASEPFTDHAIAFALIEYLVLALIPASVYGGARLLGMSPLAAGLASLLVLAPNGQGEFGRYGLGYGASVWRGSGLFTQVAALHFLVLSLGFSARALDCGKRRVSAAALLAAAALSHIVFGYTAFVSAFILTVVGPVGERLRRLVRLATIVAPAALLLLWFYVPLALVLGEVNHSRWEDAFKWNSFGAPVILRELFSGRLLDADRLPLLSILAGLGAIAAALSLRGALPRRLLALAGVWLLLYFGRDTWGHLLLLAGVPADFHLHRLQAAVEISLVLVAAWGTERAVSAASRIDRRLATLVALGVAIMIVALGVDRARYLRTNAEWGEENLSAYARERADLEATLADVRAILAERPGRVSAGKAATWGNRFKIGSVPVYAFLTREHFDQVSFLYHSMSRTSDVMVLRDENDHAQDVAFGVRAVVAPVGQRTAPHLGLRGVHGRFAVYESSPEGYFGLVDVGARYTGAPSTAYEPSSAWLSSRLLRSGIVVALDGEEVAGVPAVGRWEALPPVDSALARPRGRIVSETKSGETYTARLALDRPCYAFIKLTWFPGLVATVDGRTDSLLRVTPGFAAVAVPAGEHEVVVAYRPGALKPLLLFAGISLFAGFAWALRQPAFTAIEKRTGEWLGRAGETLDTERLRAAFALGVLTLLATRPLFRGLLIDGHDALEYPPRLVEMAQALRDGQIPPIWAPDLGSGHGQPIFEFAPPLLYWAALPLFSLGLRLAESLEVGLALLFAGGAVSVYRLGRLFGVSRWAAVGGAACWLFAPYVALDLYVRSAFAEVAAVAVAPVALLGIVRAVEKPSVRPVGVGAAAVALVPLAHNGVALLLFPAFALVALAVALAARRPMRALVAAGLTLALGLALSAFFWVPALLERDFVKTDLLREGFLHWSEHAISPLQLLWSRWGYGYSVPGTADGMSFAIGALQIALGAAGLVLGVRASDRGGRAVTIIFAVIAVAGAWLATTWSAPLWSRVETLQYLAYPWRALLLPATFLSLLAARAFDRLGSRARSAALAIVVLAGLPHTEPKGFLTFDDEYFSPDSIARKGINTTTREEYEPRWVETRPPYSAQRLVSHDSQLEVRETVIRTTRQEFLTRAAALTHVDSRTFYYPGWTVSVDGSEVPIEIAPKSGTIGFDLPAGGHRVVLELRPTAVRALAAFFSATTLAILVLVVALARRRDPGDFAVRRAS
ncbi:MAG: hypothetical protein ACREQ9_14380, partial [Candidatus Binatia bacterium]